MIGNLATVELYIKSITMTLKRGAVPSCQLVFAVGQTECSSDPFKLANPTNSNLYAIETSLKLSIQKSSLLLNKNKGSIKIYLQFSPGDRMLAGMAKVVIVEELFAETKQYRVEYCFDKKATLEARVGIQAQEINKIETLQSPTSNSSLSQIRDLHQLLFFPKEGSSRFPDNIKLQKRSSNKSSEKKFKMKDKTLSEIHNSARTLRAYSAQSHSHKGNDQNHDKSIEIYEQALTQLRRENERLHSILDLERQSAVEKYEKYQEQLNTWQRRIRELQLKEQHYKQLHKDEQKQAQGLRNQLEALMLSRSIDRINQDLTSSSHTQCKQLEYVPEFISHSKQLKKPGSSGGRTPRGSQRFQRSHFNKATNKNEPEALKRSGKIIENSDPVNLNQEAQITQLQQANQQLYQQLKLYKVSKQSLVQQIKSRQLNEQILEQQNQQMKAEIAALVKKIDQLKKCRVQNQKSNQEDLAEQLETMKKKNQQLERKVSESLKAIETFRKDALRARGEIITKDALLEKYTKGLTSPTSTHSSLPHTKEQISPEKRFQKGFQANQNSLLKLLNASIKDRESIKRTLQNFKPLSECSRQVTTQCYNLRNQVDHSFLQFVKQSQAKVKTLQYRSELNQIINSGCKKIIKAVYQTVK